MRAVMQRERNNPKKHSLFESITKWHPSSVYCCCCYSHWKSDIFFPSHRKHVPYISGALLFAIRFFFGWKNFRLLWKNRVKMWTSRENLYVFWVEKNILFWKSVHLILWFNETLTKYRDRCDNALYKSNLSWNHLR